MVGLEGFYAESVPPFAQSLLREKHGRVASIREVEGGWGSQEDSRGEGASSEGEGERLSCVLHVYVGDTTPTEPSPHYRAGPPRRRARRGWIGPTGGRTKDQEDRQHSPPNKGSRFTIHLELCKY